MIVDTIALTKGLKVVFNGAYRVAADPIYVDLIQKESSLSDTETYGFLGAVPGMIEWVGEKHVKGLEDYDYEIKNRDFEATIAVDRNEIEDDQMGLIKKKITQLAQKAKRHPDSLIHDLIEAGATALAYDGQAYFANRAAPIANDNLLAGSGVTEANLLVDIATAHETMLRFLNDQGEAFGFLGDTIVCPAALKLLFMKIVKSVNLPGETAPEFNVFHEVIKRVICDPNLDAGDPNDWYLFASSENMRPFIYQSRKSPRLVSMDKDTNEQVFMRKKLLYSAESRGNGGYGLYEMGIKIVNA